MKQMEPASYKLKSISAASRLASFRYAMNGIRRFLKEEPNAWIHLAATLTLLVAIVYFRITGTELVALVIVTGIVWVAEAFNTVVEKIMDFISPAYHPQVGLIKDISAGAVLISAIVAVITAAVIFIPKIF
jgi:diacylglycerol kinase (ATP)